MTELCKILDAYTEYEMATILGISTATLENRRYRRQDHPPYKKIGRDTFYPKAEAMQWISKRPLCRELADETESTKGRKKAALHAVREAGPKD